MNRCSENVWEGFHQYPCRKPVKVERDGKHYCTVHDPERIAKRRQDKREKESVKADLTNQLASLFPNDLSPWVQVDSWGLRVTFRCKDAEAVRALAARFKESK